MAHDPFVSVSPFLFVRHGCLGRLFLRDSPVCVLVFDVRDALCEYHDLDGRNPGRCRDDSVSSVRGGVVSSPRASKWVDARGSRAELTRSVFVPRRRAGWSRIRVVSVDDVCVGVLQCDCVGWDAPRDDRFVLVRGRSARAEYETRSPTTTTRLVTVYVVDADRSIGRTFHFVHLTRV